ncbi:MAG: polysaccharide biosynthesis tyrosine autokinase [Bacteroidetes bacterium]|nr:polysaccharide biosynthesis tyrosine autokinase [Bacteroidota bacterium]
MTQSNDSIVKHLTDFIQDILKYWYVAVISLGITLGAAMFYLKYAARTYEVQASVLLHTEKSNAFGAKSENLMRVSELIEVDKNLQNEIYFMQSTPLIRSVVEEMDLQVSYFLQEDRIPKEAEFSLKDLYRDAPFIVILNQEHLQPVNTLIYIRVIDEETFQLSAQDKSSSIFDFSDESMVYESTLFRLSGIHRFGEEVSNPFCSFRILLNSNYNSNAYQDKDLFFQINTTRQLTKQFKGALTIEASAVDATIAQMSLKMENVTKGIEFLSGLIERYTDHNLEEKNHLAIKTIEHLNFQLSDISSSLGSSEQELQNIRHSSSLMNVDEKAGNLYNQLQTSETQKEEIERRKNYLVQMEEYFSSNRDSSGFLAPSAMGLDDPLLSGLIQELTTLTSERQQIINNNQLRNPRLRTIDISIGNLKEVILENLQYSISASNSELRDVNGKINNLNSDYASLPYTQRKMLGIERKFNLNENIYMSLLEQRIQAQIIKSSNQPDCEIIEPPQYASVQSPKGIIVMIAALFFGLLIPSAFVIGKKLFTSKVIDKEELRKYTGLTLIGNIPQNNKNQINVINEQPNSIVSEAFHTLRSNIIYYLMGKKNQVILVTSTMEGEGKSFSSLNIASSLAVTNNKTVLVEFDLRRPSELYSKLGIRGLVGVSSFLIDKASLEEITISSDVENLDFVLAGQIPPNPIELISSGKTEELFARLREKYDYIVIDTPPYGVLTDSFVLMKFADIKIYVSRLGYVKRRILLSSLEDIESKNIDNVQILINGDTPKQGSYGKYYTDHDIRKGMLAKQTRKGAREKSSKKTGNA